MTILAETVETVKMENDQIVSGTTLQSLTGLAFAVLAGARYAFEFTFVCRVHTNPTGVPQIGMTFPAADAFGAMVMAQFGLLAFITTEMKWHLTTSGVGVSSGTIASDTTNKFYGRIIGTISPSADGTLQLQMAANAIAQPNPFTIYAGSGGTLRRVA